MYFFYYKKLYKFNDKTFWGETDAFTRNEGEPLFKANSYMQLFLLSVGLPVDCSHGYRKKTGSILSVFITLWVCQEILIQWSPSHSHQTWPRTFHIFNMARLVSK